MSTASCPSCRVTNPENARFCMKCGTQLKPAVQTEGPSKARPDIAATIIDPAIPLAAAREDRPAGIARTVIDDAIFTDDKVGVRPIQATVVQASSGDVDHVDTTPLPQSSRERAGAMGAVGGKLVRFGRDPKNDVVVEDRFVSGFHARLTWPGDSGLLEDLESANGTFVNGQRITAPTPVHVGDLIHLGHQGFRIAPGGVFIPHKARGIAALSAVDLAVATPDKGSLTGVSLTLGPCELAGVIALRGACCEPLLAALRGDAQPQSGRVLLNGKDIYAANAELRPLIGYVAGADLLPVDMPIAEALAYTLRARQPFASGVKEVEARVNEVLALMKLQGIGGKTLRGLRSTGGKVEACLANLAAELVLDPAVLILDRILVGLPETEQVRLVHALKELASAGKTIVMALGEPSEAVLREIDLLIVLDGDDDPAQGAQLVYLGPAWPDGVEFFSPSDRTDMAMFQPFTRLAQGLKGDPLREWQRRFSATEHKKKLIEARAAQPTPPPLAPPRSVGGVPFPIDPLGALVMRTLRGILCQPGRLIALVAWPLLSALVIALLCSTKASQNLSVQNWATVTPVITAALHLMVLAVFAGSAWVTSREMVAERGIYLRERAGSLRLSSYVLSKLTVFFGYALLNALLMLLIVTMTCRLKGTFFSLWLILTLVGLAGSALGLTISALAHGVSESSHIVMVLLILAVLFGGGVVARGNLMAPVRLLAQMSPIRWGYEGVLLAESQKRQSWLPHMLAAPLPKSSDDEAGNRPPRPGQDLADLDFPDEFRTGVATACLALLGLVGLFTAMLFGAVRLSEPDSSAGVRLKSAMAPLSREGVKIQSPGK